MMEWKNTADVVIIGGGIIGVSTAYYLAQNGMKNIVLIEKGTICGGSTGRCGAGIRAQWGTEMNCRLGIAALDIFEQLDQDLGMSVGLNQGGYLLVAYSEKELDTLRKGMELQNSLGIKSRQITLREAREICPGLAADDAVGFFFHGRDGHADPFLTTFAYLEAAKRLGVTCHRHTECTGILVDGGAVRGVETDRGIIHAPIVINCAGAYAQFIARMAGIEIPNWAERHEIMITEPEDYENKTTWQFIEEMSKTLVRLLPRTRGIRIARQWSGMYDMTPDAQPIIGETDVKNFYHSTGYSGHGFMLAPVAGKILAQHITGKKPDIDFSMLDYRRFARGEHIRESNVV
jgi:sarcosine oxidase subunit beta